MLPKQKELIHEKDWDYLLVLDACRYDYFEKIYQKYLQGNLSKVKSEGSQTLEWLKNTFSNTYFEDTVYVSANPFINSKGLREFSGEKHFYTVIDVWDWGWNDKHETVLPKTVSEALLKHKNKYANKRYIVHFEQPHGPYLELNPLKTRKDISKKLRFLLGNKFVRCLGRDNFMKTTKFFQKYLPLDDETDEDDKCSTNLKLIAKKHGQRFLRKNYEKNLEIVLREVANLLDNIQGKIIMTSDHGEMLGEDGLYGHFKSSNHNILREVPWMEVVTTHER